MKKSELKSKTVGVSLLGTSSSTRKTATELEDIRST